MSNIRVSRRFCPGTNAIAPAAQKPLASVSRTKHKRTPEFEVLEQLLHLSVYYVSNNSHSSSTPGSFAYAAVHASSNSDSIVFDAGVGAVVDQGTVNVSAGTIDLSADPGDEIYNGKAPGGGLTIQFVGAGTFNIIDAQVQGGLALQANATLNVTGCTFSNSTGSGAINASAGGDTLNVSSSVLTKSSAGLSNGNGFVVVNGTTTLTGDQFLSDDDSAVDVTGGTTSATGCSFSGSGANYAVLLSGGSATLNNDTWTVNTGGDVSETNTTLTLENSNLSGNSITTAGVAEIALSAGSTTLDGDILNNNVQAGSVIAAALNGGSLTIDDSGVVGNMTGSQVLGTVDVTGPTGTLVVTGSTLANNTAKAGSTIYLGAGVTATLNTSALVSNTNAGGDGVGGIEAASGGSAVLGDTIVAGNLTTDAGAGITGAYNNVQTGNLSGLTNNQTGSPQYNLNTTTDVFTLDSTSPDIGTGSNGTNIGPDQITVKAAPNLIVTSSSNSLSVPGSLNAILAQTNLVAGDVIEIASGVGTIDETATLNLPLSITIDGSQDPGASVSFSGVVFALTSNADVTLSSLTIQGGIVLDGGSTGNFTSDTIENGNDAGIQVNSLATANILNSTFKIGAGFSYLYGIANSGSTIVTGSTFSDSISDSQSGATGELSVTGSTFTGVQNSYAVLATLTGAATATFGTDNFNADTGGIFDYTGGSSSSLTLQKSNISNNSGAVTQMLLNGPATLTADIINSNTETNGSFIASQLTTGETLSLVNTGVVYNNSGTSTTPVTGTIVVSGGALSVTGSTIADNDVSNGAAIYASALSMISTDVVYNTNANLSGVGGVLISTGGTGYLDNDIIYANIASDVGGATFTGGYDNIGSGSTTSSLTNSQFNENPHLASLNTTTDTIEPYTDSPVVGAGDPAQGGIIGSGTSPVPGDPNPPGPNLLVTSSSNSLSVPGSLNAILAQANLVAGDVIEIASGVGTIVETASLSLTLSITIDGSQDPGAAVSFSGVVFQIENNATVTLSSLTVQGGVVVAGGSTGDFTSDIIENGNDAGIQVDSLATANVLNSTFKIGAGFSYLYGIVNSGNAVVTGSTFQDAISDTQSGVAGGLSVTGSTFTAVQSSYAVVATLSGGATATFSTDNFNADKSGIFNYGGDSTSTLVVENSNISNNSGAVTQLLLNGPATLTADIINSNTETSGSLIASQLSAGEKLSLVDTGVVYNQSGTSTSLVTGTIVVSGATLSVTGSTIADNDAWNGAAVYASALTMVSTDVVYNTNENRVGVGGVLISTGGTGYLDNDIIYANIASDVGGATFTGGYDNIGSGTTTTSLTNSQFNENPHLAPLNTTTDTIEPYTDSPVIGAGDPSQGGTIGSGTAPVAGDPNPPPPPFVLTVTSSSNSASVPGSLNYVLAQPALQAGDVIEIASGVGAINETATLSLPLSITIDGSQDPGASVSFSGVVFEIKNNSTVTLSGLTIQGGTVVDGGSTGNFTSDIIENGSGAGIQVDSLATANVLNSTFNIGAGFSYLYGIVNNGNVVVTGSTFADGIFDTQTGAMGQLSVTGSTFTGVQNSYAIVAALSGTTGASLSTDRFSNDSGGIVNYSGGASTSLTLANSNISNNSDAVTQLLLNGAATLSADIINSNSETNGSLLASQLSTGEVLNLVNTGVVYNNSGTSSTSVVGTIVVTGGKLSVTGSTIADNDAWNGAAVYASALTMVSTDVVYNTNENRTGVGGVLISPGGTGYLDNDIIYGNIATDVGGATFTGGYDNIGSGTTTTSLTNSQLNDSPHLAPLNTTTDTIEPYTDSPVIGAGDPSQGGTIGSGTAPVAGDPNPPAPTVLYVTNASSNPTVPGSLNYVLAQPGLVAGDVIEIASGVGTIFETTTLSLPFNMTIDGSEDPGASVNYSGVVFAIESDATVTLSGLTIQGATVLDAAGTGNFISDVIESDNDAGIEINLGGTANISSSTFKIGAGYSYAYGIVNNGNAVITASTFQDGILDTQNGATGELSVTGSTFSGVQNSYAVAASLNGTTTATFSKDTFSGNTAGIFNYNGGASSTLTVANSTIANNSGSVTQMLLDGPAILTADIINSNTETGGALISSQLSTGETLSLVNTGVVYNNSGTAITPVAGTVVVNGGTLSITESTLAKNDAFEGAAVYASALSMVSTDVVYNTNENLVGVGGVFISPGGTGYLDNDIIYGNIATDVGGTTFTGGYDDIGTGSVTTSLTNSLIGVNPHLAPLNTTTDTIEVYSDSPVIGAGDPSQGGNIGSGTASAPGDPNPPPPDLTVTNASNSVNVAGSLNAILAQTTLAPGDVIEIAPGVGTIYETTTLDLPLSITIDGSQDPGASVNYSGVVFEIENNATVTLSGLSIQGGTLVDSGSRGNFAGDLISNGNDAGIQVNGGGASSVLNTTFKIGAGFSYPYGIVNGNGVVTVMSSAFQDGIFDTQTGAPGQLTVTGSSFTGVQNSYAVVVNLSGATSATFNGGNFTGDAGGIFNYNGVPTSSLAVQDSNISGNSGAVPLFVLNGPATLSADIINDNTATSGSVVTSQLTAGESVSLVDSGVVGNISGQNSPVAGTLVVTGGAFLVTGSTVAYNKAWTGAAVYASALSMVSTDVVYNTNENLVGVGGVLISTGGTGYLDNDIIYGNIATDVGGTTFTGGYDDIGTGGITTSLTNSLIGVDPHLGPLNTTTDVFEIYTDSPVIGKGDPSQGGTIGSATVPPVGGDPNPPVVPIVIPTFDLRGVKITAVKIKRGRPTKALVIKVKTPKKPSSTVLILEVIGAEPVEELRNGRLVNPVFPAGAKEYFEVYDKGLGATIRQLSKFGSLDDISFG
jgi:small nuclear ribonucleoprotein (snRNP)-like protein